MGRADLRWRAALGDSSLFLSLFFRKANDALRGLSPVRAAEVLAVYSEHYSRAMCSQQAHTLFTNDGFFFHESLHRLSPR